MRASIVAVALALAGSALLMGGDAQAFERQWHLGGSVGTGSFIDVPGSGAPFGDSFGPPVIGAHLGYGLSDMFDGRLELSWGEHSLDGNPETVDPELERTGVLTSLLGLAYKIDVIEWVPSVGLLAGYSWFLGGPGPGAGGTVDPETGGAVTVGASLGLDYSLDRDIAVGVQLRYLGNLSDAPTSLSDAGYFAALLRFEHTWGW